MTWRANIVTAALLMTGSMAGSGCERDSKPEDKLSTEEKRRLIAKIEREKRAKKRRAEARKADNAEPSDPPTASASAAPPAPSASAGAGGGSTGSADTIHRAPAEPAAPAEGPWRVDEAVSIAPAGPVTATSRGAVMVNRNKDVFLARLGGLSHRKKPMKTPIRPLPESAAPFPIRPGPALVGGKAYWVTGGGLVRRPIGSKGAIEVLARDARNGTRVAAPTPMRDQKLPDIPPTVAYIVAPESRDDPPRAKVWVEGGGTRVLTPEGSSTDHVALVQTADGLIALSVAARTAMTPVHARRIRFHDGAPSPDEDLVTWVGGGIHMPRELTVLASRDDALWGFLPHEQSITQFGLARLDITATPNMETPTHWIHYHNGLDPAPVAAGHLCGTPVVVYAEPETAHPDARQRLVVREVDREPPRAQVVARADSFYEVSFAEASGGALVAYVADWVTWARTLRCKTSPN